MAALPPDLREGDIRLRAIRMRDTKALERELMLNRAWLRQWEATLPDGFTHFDTKAAVRSLLAYSRSGGGVAMVIEYHGVVIGQLNISGITHGSLSSASIGYWLAERFAGKSITPTAVAMATDYCFRALHLHRVEICIRPENQASLRVVEKLGFRFEGRRDRYIHINGDWRDHDCFALCAEDVPEGVLSRFLGQKANTP
jgi:ribosomal-protein-alanine N-acetyltransferase